MKLLSRDVALMEAIVKTTLLSVSNEISSDEDFLVVGITKNEDYMHKSSILRHH